MHPKMMSALAKEAQRDRENERREAHVRSLATANRAQGFEHAHAASVFAWRLLDGISLRARLS